MGFIDYIAFSMLAVSALVFIINSKGTKLKKLPYFSNQIALEWFFFNNHSQNSSNFGMSTAAASTSLATVIFFFIAGIDKYGLYLVWCGISYLVGQFLFIKVMKEISVNTVNMSTVTDFWYERTGANLSARVIAILTCSAFLTLLFVELYVGSKILSFYFSINGEIFQFITFFLLLLVVCTYVSIGGIEAVFKSDAWQYKLMKVSILFLFISSLFSIFSKDSLGFDFRVLEKEVDSGIFVFLIWVTIQNITLPFTQLSSWQRLASTSSINQAEVGLKEVFKGFLLLWILPIFSLLIFDASNQNLFFYDGLGNSINISNFFNYFRESNNLFIFITFPVLFVGFSSALFSTADSALMAVLLSVCDKSTFRSRILNCNNIVKIKFRLVSIVLIIMLVELVLYSVLSPKNSSEYLNLTYLIFSQLTIFFPQVGLVIVSRTKVDKLVSSVYKFDVINSIGLLISWILFILICLYGDLFLSKDKNLTVLIASLLSIFLSSLFLASAFIFTKKTSTLLLEG